MWIFLMCLAGNSNDDGFVFFTKEIPYTDEMLAEEFKMDINTIRLGLATFEKFGMIEIVDDFICLSAWEKWQSTDKLSELKEYNRIKKRESRARRREKMSKDVNDLSMTCQPCQDIDIDKDIDKDKEKDNNLIVSKDTIRQTDVRRVIDEWNKLQEVGINPIRDIKPSSKRCQLLKGRIREYGIDDVINAIENVRNSDFLRGENNRGWTITFDWFVKPNNFTKVLEGNYNKEGQHGTSRTAQTHVKPLIPFNQCGGSEISDTPFAD